MLKLRATRILRLLVALTTAAGVSIALMSSSASADGEACVDNGEESLGNWMLYISTKSGHMVKDVDVRADGDGIVIKSVTLGENTFDYNGFAMVTVPDNEKVYEIRYSVTDTSTKLWFCFHDQIGFWYPIEMENWHSNNRCSNSEHGNGQPGLQLRWQHGTDNQDPNSDDNTGTDNQGSNSDDNTGTDNQDSNSDGNTETNNQGSNSGNNGNSNTGNSGTSPSATTPVPALGLKSERQAATGKSTEASTGSGDASVKPKPTPSSVSARSQQPASVWTGPIVIPTPEPVPTPKPPHTGDAGWSGSLLVTGALLLIGGLVVFNLSFTPTRTWADGRSIRPMQDFHW